ncbi:MAG TPA: metallophosphoesterase family protein [Albidovulum sp.]|uniref:metallophosphoesterase family protein n=1 Tax=Albidovulum sp. TaxID=1872424 RepID=UPI002CC9AEB3|nr:metallophosphoesterase family protein [Albidovulum sp.]
MRIYAIGDVHGQLEKLREVHALVRADFAASAHPGAEIVHVGDLVDRGPDSRGVISYLIDGIAAGEPWVVLKGNHDRMFEGFMGDPDYHDPCLRPDLYWSHPRLGGDTTLASYGVHGAGERLFFDLHDDAIRNVPEAHRAFIRALPLMHRVPGLAFVHAGIRPGVPFEEQTEDDLLWIRQGYLDDSRDHGVLIVHGHTPVEAVTHYGNRLNIDTGAGYGRALSVVVIEGSQVWQLTPAGRVPVVPA